MNFKKSMEYLKTGNSALYKKDKISTVKIEFEKNGKVIIRVPYNQELIKKVKMISGRRRDGDVKKLSEIRLGGFKMEVEI